jgi:hypothetical protein
MLKAFRSRLDLAPVDLFRRARFAVPAEYIGHRAIAHDSIPT